MSSVSEIIEKEPLKRLVEADWQVVVGFKDILEAGVDIKGLDSNVIQEATEKYGVEIKTNGTTYEDTRSKIIYCNISTDDLEILNTQYQEQSMGAEIAA